MKKRVRRARFSNVAAVQKSHTQSVAGVKKPARRRGRTNNNAAKITSPSVACDRGFEDVGTSDRSARLQLSTTVSAVETEGEERPEHTSRNQVWADSALHSVDCHGKLSPWRLRHAFNKWPGEPEGVPDQTEPAQEELPNIYKCPYLGC
ncbi:unnamed protein product [Coregonus sp. 'balchen']|nr:unnamed protein product [Coregonus sp. 'balchen']